MAAKSTAVANKTLDHLLGKTSYTMPGSLYMGLLLAVPTAAATSNSGLTEANSGSAQYTGYARKQILGTDLNAASAGQSTNANQLAFAACTGGSAVIIAFGLFVPSSGAGDMQYFGTVTSKTIDSTNQPATVAVSQLVVTES